MTPATRAWLAALTLAASSLGLGCDSTPPATREWQASDHTHPPDSVPVPVGTQAAVPAQPDDGLTSEQRAARSVFLVACAGCHGADGRGDGPQRAPVMRIPSFASREWQESRTDAEIVSIISLGRGMMPAFAERIPAAGMEALVEHLRGLAPAPAAEVVDAGTPAPDAAQAEAGEESAAEERTSGDPESGDAAASTRVPNTELSATGEGVVE